MDFLILAAVTACEMVLEGRGEDGYWFMQESLAARRQAQHADVGNAGHAGEEEHGASGMRAS